MSTTKMEKSVHLTPTLSPERRGNEPLPATPLPVCLTRCEVGRLLLVSVSTVDRMVADGHLKRVKVRRLVRFSPTEVEAYLNKNLRPKNS